VTQRPIDITILSLYLLIVFGISAIGSMIGAVRELAPYTTSEWLILTVPKLLAFAAGAALWRMFKIGAWLWFGGALLGWVLAISLGTGFFPSLTMATIVSVVILGLSAWAIVRNWHLLKRVKFGTPETPEAAE
jgi:hypothetical protein